MRAVFTNYGEL